MMIIECNPDAVQSKTREERGVGVLEEVFEELHMQRRDLVRRLFRRKMLRVSRHLIEEEFRVLLSDSLS